MNTDDYFLIPLVSAPRDSRLEPDPIIEYFGIFRSYLKTSACDAVTVIGTFGSEARALRVLLSSKSRRVYGFDLVSLDGGLRAVGQIVPTLAQWTGSIIPRLRSSPVSISS